MSKKVLLFTLLGKNYNTNYGALFQAYGLYRHLVRHGFDCELADVVSQNWPEGYFSRLRLLRLMKQDQYYKYILAFPVRKVSRRFEEHMFAKSKYDLERAEKFRHTVMSLFKFSSNQFSDYYDLIRQRESIKKKYDLLVVGSDQVWNPFINTVDRLRLFLLDVDFGDDIEKLAYASSIAGPIPRSLYPLFRRALSRFKAISVRELSSSRYLFPILGYKPDIVLDPCFLMSADEWRALKKPPVRVPDGPYILVYDWWRKAKLLKLIAYLSDRFGYKIIYYYPFSLTSKVIESRGNGMSFYTFSPQEFLWLLDNADFVVTTSFHGTVFSILFEKDFLSLSPSPRPFIYPYPSRLTYLLSMVGLLDRFAWDLEEAFRKIPTLGSVDWVSVRSKLQHAIDYSQSILLDMLNK